MEVSAISHSMGSICTCKKVDGHIIRTVCLNRIDNREVAQISHDLIVLVHVCGQIQMSTSGNSQRSLSKIETIEVGFVKLCSYRSINFLAQKGIKTDSAVKKWIL